MLLQGKHPCLKPPRRDFDRPIRSVAGRSADERSQMASPGKPVQVTDSLDDLGDKELIQSALRGDIEAIRRYGEAHTKSWTGLRFENEPKVRIVASFIWDLEQHDSELRRLLKHPDRLVLEQSRWTKSQLDDMASEIHSTPNQRQARTGRPVMARLGVGIGVVSVGLQADQEELAEELVQRYADAIELEVGAFGYPMGRERSRRRAPRRPEPEIVDIEELELCLHLERRVIEVGDRAHGGLVVRNVSTHHVGRFYCGQPILAVLVDGSTDEVSDSWTRMFSEDCSSLISISPPQFTGAFVTISSPGE